MAIVTSPARAARAMLGAHLVATRCPAPCACSSGCWSPSPLVLTVQDGTPWLNIPTTPFEYLYNGVLVGSAVLCLIRAALRRSERMAWTMMGVALALYAAGNIYWQLALSDLAAAPYPSRGRCLAGSASCPVVLRGRRAAGPRAHAAPGFPAVARRHRRRAHHRRDQRGARLRRPAGLDRRRPRRGGDEPGLSARRHDPAGQRHRRHGRRPQPPGPQLAVVRRRDRRLRRLRLRLPPADRQGAPTSATRCSTSAGSWPALLVGIAAWQPVRAQALHRRRAAEHHRADRARAGQPRVARLRPLRAASTCSPSRSPAPRWWRCSSACR